MFDQVYFFFPFFFFFFNDTATTEIYTLSLHDALPIYPRTRMTHAAGDRSKKPAWGSRPRSEEHTSELQSHHELVCRLLLEKKKKDQTRAHPPAGVHAATAVGAGHVPYLLLPRLHHRLLRLHFFFNDTAPTEIYTLSLHDALPI